MVAEKPRDQQQEIKYRPTKPGKIYTSPINAPVPEIDPVHDTLSKQFLLRVKELGGKIAMRKKRYGIWQEYTWNEVYEHVSLFFHALKSMGLEKGETVVIIGENDPEMYWTQLAAHAASAMTCCVFADALAEPDLLYVIHSTNATFVVAHDQEQVDKALAIKEKVPQIRRVIYWEEKGMWSYDDEWLLSFEEAEQMGHEHRQGHPELFRQSVAETNIEDTAILSMTSGTTSLPKFAMKTHSDMLWRYTLNRPYFSFVPDENWLSFSPMAWVTEQLLGFTGSFLLEGSTANFPESPETVQHDMREIAPAALLFPSRVWENLAASIRFRLNDSTWINRKLFEWFLPGAYAIIDLEDADKEIPLGLQFLRWLGDMAVFQPLRDKLGLVRAHDVLTAGAMLSPDVIRFFRALGIELRQLYASTETIGTSHLAGDVKLETVGVHKPGVEIKITEEQEILLRSKAIFAGYYGDPAQTGEAIDEEGWYHTGDAGYMREDGHLVYLERVKDMIELANGHTFSPQFIEGRLKFSQYIQDIMTIGGLDMDYVTAIIVINFENVSRWAEKRGLTFTTFVDLSQKPEIYDLVTQDVLRVNESLPQEGRVKRFVILHKEFDADEGELTRTRKLKRRTLHQKYADILEALYSDNIEKVSVRAEVKYRDGREAVVETELKIRDVSIS